MRSVAVNTELHERFEKRLVGLMSQMDLNKSGNHLASFTPFLVFSIHQG